MKLMKRLVHCRNQTFVFNTYKQLGYWKPKCPQIRIGCDLKTWMIEINLEYEDATSSKLVVISNVPTKWYYSVNPEILIERNGICILSKDKEKLEHAVLQCPFA